MVFAALGAVLVAAFAVGALIVPDQMTDAMALLAEPPHLQTWAFLILLPAAALSLHYAASTAIEFGGDASSTSLATQRIALLIASMPALATGYVFFNAWRWSQLSAAPHAKWLVGLTIVGVLIVLVTLGLRTLGSPLNLDAKPSLAIPGAPRRLRKVYGVAIFAPAISSAILFGRPHYAGASAVGPICVLLLWVAAAAPLAAALSVVAARTGWPVLAGLFGLALLFDFLNLNENNAVRQVRGQPPISHPTVEQAFRTWLLSRYDRTDYDARRPYPVFVVTAEGGGLGAAYFTAAVLASLQDACPRFAQHAFAISAVSGGSVGAAVFAALAKHNAINGPLPPCTSLTVPFSGPLRDLADKTLHHDLLSPVVAATLFPNLLQQVLPWPIPAFDNARAFEHQLESSWQQATQSNDFATTFEELEGGFPTGAVPALFLTATEVETGLPMSVSTLRLCDEHQRSIASLADMAPDLQMPLSTAVGLGARIPVIASPGLLSVNGNVRCGYTRGNRHFVDGAYFENSGTVVALQILAQIWRARSPDLPRFAIYVIDIGGWETLAARPQHGMERFAPLTAMLNARIGHGYLNRERLLDKLRETSSLGVTTEVYQFRLTRPRGRVPLAWVLSRASRAEIAGQLPCADGVPNSERLRHPSCVANAQSFRAVLRAIADSRPDQARSGAALVLSR